MAGSVGNGTGKGLAGLRGRGVREPACAGPEGRSRGLPGPRLAGGVPDNPIRSSGVSPAPLGDDCVEDTEDAES